jgi:DNA-binding beta-propeller fold protein YncE
VAADAYDFVDGSTLLVAERRPTATLDVDLTGFALWDLAADRRAARLEVGFGFGWAGKDRITSITPDLQTHWYDAASRTIVDGDDIPIGVPDECPHLWASAGGERSYCGLLSGAVWTLDPATRRRIEPTLQVEGVPASVSATRAGQTVVVTALRDDGQSVTTVFDGTTGEPIGGPLVGPNITSVSVDGSVLVGASGGSITRYDLATLEPLVDLPGTRGGINTLQLSDDGRVLLVTALDQTVSVYDVASGTRLGDPIPMDAPFIYGAFLRADGDEAAVTDRTGIEIWDLDPLHQREAACQVAGRNLTATEWSTYLGGLGDPGPTCPQYA